MRWQLQDAKNRFSEVVELALSDGAQTVTRHGRDTVVILSIDDYRRLRGVDMTFKNYLMQGPSFEGIDLSRDSTPDRDVDLSATEERLAANFGLPRDKEPFSNPKRWARKEAHRVIDELRRKRKK